MGNVIAMPICGLLCQYGFDEGWGSIFYVIGMFDYIWCLDFMAKCMLYEMSKCSVYN